MTILMLCLALALCLLLSFFFSGAEVGIISVNRFRLETQGKEGDPSATRLLGLLGETQRLLVMVLIGTNLANVLLALFFKQLLETLWPELTRQAAVGVIMWSEVLGLLILTPFMVVTAELLPKALFRAQADRMVSLLQPILRVCLWLMSPAIILVEGLTRLLIPTSEQRSRAMRQLSRQDLINLVAPQRPGETAAGEEAAATEETPQPTQAPNALGQAIEREIGAEEEWLSEENDQRWMVQNIIELSEGRASEIMTPLVRLVAIHLNRIDMEGFLAIAKETGYSRFPVYNERIVNLVGFVDVFRVLREALPGSHLRDFVERPLFVPGSVHIDDLLQQFLSQRVKNAIVVDEFGGCIGWISREDIFEEIVGELEDELDEPVEMISEQPDGSFIIEGRTEIHLVNQRLGTQFSDEDWETMAGLVLDTLQRIPKTGDQAQLPPWRATVQRMDGLRIDAVRLERI